MGNIRPLFIPNTIYHVYNHGNAEDNIFREEENYHYFLKRYAEYIFPVAKTYAFCLLPNHFHLAVEIKSKEKLKTFFKNEGKDLIGLPNLSGLISKQFSNFLNAYSKSFNKKYDRTGKLFKKSLNRKPVEYNRYYKNLVAYIHHNPVLHGFVEHPSEWPYSSYQIMLSRKGTQLEREEVLDWFGGKNPFVEFHNQNQEISKEEFY